MRLSEAAIADLLGIADWLGDRAGDDFAEAYVRRIEARCRKLADFPERGTPRPEYGEDVRSIPFQRRATIQYRVEGDAVVIRRVLYAGRALEA